MGACTVNMIVLLARIVIYNANLHSLTMLVHFLTVIIMYLHDSIKKSTKTELAMDSGNITKIITPLLLYMYVKTSD